MLLNTQQKNNRTLAVQIAVHACERLREFEPYIHAVAYSSCSVYVKFGACGSTLRISDHPTRHAYKWQICLSDSFVDNIGIFNGKKIYKANIKNTFKFLDFMREVLSDQVT